MLRNKDSACDFEVPNRLSIQGRTDYVEYQKSRIPLTSKIDKQLARKATCRYDGHAYVHNKSQAS